MSATDTTSDASTEAEQSYDFDHIGIEFEYPVARTEDDAPRGNGRMSRGLHRHDDFADDNTWPVRDIRPGARGAIGRDHCGAEIRSGVLELHTEEPEQWYNESIRIAEECGFPFAATGYGESKWGLHMHVSPIDSDSRNVIDEACDEEWARVFFCSSVNAQSLDPWRHYSASSPQRPWSGPKHIGEDDHWEFRLPEPVLPDHFELMMEFWRLVETDSAEAAVDFARELVLSKDERLTPIVQYNQLREERANWPTDSAFASDGQTDSSVAHWFHDLMEQ